MTKLTNPDERPPPTVVQRVETAAAGVEGSARDLKDNCARYARWIGAILFVVMFLMLSAIWVLRTVDDRVDDLSKEVDTLEQSNDEMRRTIAFVNRLLCDRLPDAEECQPVEEAP